MTHILKLQTVEGDATWCGAEAPADEILPDTEEGRQSATCWECQAYSTHGALKLFAIDYYRKVARIPLSVTFGRMAK